MAGIEHDLGVVLPVSTILDALTPRALAQRVADARTAEAGHCVVPVRPQGVGPAVFCVHGISGDVVFARTLALAMGRTRPVHGLRASGLHGGEAPVLGVANMAARYLSEIDTVRPDGRHLLFGYCGGSLVAYEMAQQMARAGRPAAALVLVDPPVYPIFAPWYFHDGLPLRIRQWRSRLRAWRLNMTFRDGMSGRTRRDHVRRIFISALCEYAPSPYPGPMLVVHSTDRRAQHIDPARGLPRHFGPHVEFAEVGPDHLSLFTSHVAAVSQAINTFLDRVAPVQQPADEAL